jgi:hypothetical protein
MYNIASTPKIPRIDFSQESPTPPKELFARFSSEALECFKAVMEGAGLRASEKYSCLRQLRNSIKEVKLNCPEEYKGSELADLSTKIRTARKRLRLDYSTNSHWLVCTEHGRHMKSMKPDLRKTPSVKLSLNDVMGTLNNIASLSKGLDRIRALQHFHKMVLDELVAVESRLLTHEDEGDNSPTSFGKDEVDDYEASTSTPSLIEKREYLLKALERLKEFGDVVITFEEKISLLFMINEWDKDPIQEVELKSLVDRYGKDFVLYFMSKEGMTAELLFNSLKILLLEVHEKNPGIPLIEIVRKWPIALAKLENAAPLCFELDFLMGLSDEPGFSKDPIAVAVQEYLLTFLDGTGLTRLNALHRKAQKKLISAGDFYKEVGRIIYLLRRFNLHYQHIFGRFSPVKASSKKPTDFASAIESMSKKVGGRAVVREATQLAQTLLFRTFSVYQALVAGESFDEGTRITELRAQIPNEAQKLTQALYKLVKNASTENERICLIANFMYVANLMASLGDVYTAGEIAAVLENTRFDAELKPSWERYKTLKCYKRDFVFVDGLMYPFDYFKAYRMHMEKLELQGVLCIPMLAVSSNELDKYNQAAATNRDHTLEQLQALLPEEKLDELCKRLYIGTPDDEKDKNWQIGHILQDVGKLWSILNLMEEIPETVFQEIRKYIVEKRSTDAGIEGFNKKLFTLSFAIQIRLANKPIVPVSHSFLEWIDSHGNTEEKSAD